MSDPTQAPRAGEVEAPRTPDLEALERHRAVCRSVVVHGACRYVAGTITRKRLANYVQNYRDANAELEAAIGGNIQ